MDNKALQWLYQELPGLINKGVLSQTTADKLHEYYGELKSTDKKSFTIIFCSVLGASLIGLGIILLFAHNWEQLSRPMRVCVSLSPLIIGQILAFWVLLKHPTSHALKESVAIFVSLMVGAAIALVSQTYNISGEMIDFILSWMLLIVPLVYLMEVTIPAVIYVAGISTWVCYYWDVPQQAIIFWPLLAVIVPHFIWSLYQDRYDVRAGILAVVIAVSVCFGMEQITLNLNEMWHGFWIIVYSSIATIFYLLGIWKFKSISTNWQRPIHCFGEIGVFIMMLLLTFRFPWDLIQMHQPIVGWNLSWVSFLNYLLTLLLVGTAISMFFRCVKHKDLMSSLFGALPVLVVIGCGLSVISTAIPMLLFDIFVFVVSTMQITIGIRTDNLRIVNQGMFMLAVFILMRFFDSDVNFIIKGLVFIAIGIGFLMTNVTIIRRRKGVS